MQRPDRPPAGTQPAPLLRPDGAVRADRSSGIGAVLAAFLVPVVFSGEMYHPFWAPKAAGCLLLLGPGLVALARMVAAREPAAVFAALFLGAATLSTMASGHAALALVGGAGSGTGLLFVAALVGAWALASTAGERRRNQVVVALVAGALVNAGMAWLQARDLVPDALASPGRAAGLMGNPVHLGALVAGAVLLVGDLVARSRRWVLWLPAVALLGGAAQLSGGRSAAGITVLALAGAVRRAGWRRGAALAVAVGIGFVAATSWTVDGGITASSRSVGERSTSQVSERVAVWKAAAGATLERPVLGWGPGRFEAATSTRSTADASAGGVRVYDDAHNWVVEYATTTGLLGLALLLAWLVAAARGAGGPLAGFALLAGAAFLLVEPVSVVLTPLVLLALGASRTAPPIPPAERPAWRAAAGVGLAAGALAAGTLLAGEVFLRQAVLDTDIEAYEQGAALVPAWADVSRLGARIEAFAGLHSQAARERALDLAGQATRREPEDASAWTYLGKLEMVWGDGRRAEVALDRALGRNPWSADALLARALLAERSGDPATVAATCGRLAAVDRTPEVCRGPATVTS